MAFELFSAHTCTAAAQRRMEKIQSIAHIGNWIWDIKSDELSWSDEMYRIFGIAKENFSGSLEKTIEEAIHPEDRQKVKESNESVAMKSKPIPLEYRIIRPDKSVRTLWAEAGELTHDAEGKPLLLAGYVQDITDRRQAEETLMKALKKNEALYRNLMENSIDAVYLLNREGTVLHVNRVASEMLGYSYAELLGLTISDIDINYPQQGFIDFWNKKPESSSILFETQHRHKNGTIIPVEVNGIFFTLEGEKTFFGVARMLRDRKD
jgi:PAS domain S-box-containing protein